MTVTTIIRPLEILAWTLLVSGGIVGALPVPTGWDEGSAYVVALGLALLIGSYIVRRLRRRG